MEHIVIAILILFARKTIGRKCESNKLKGDSNWISNDISREYVCPRPDGPTTHTECCWDAGCCPPDPTSDSQGDMLLKMICIVVIVVCVVIIIALLIGCFWARGMCYQCCRHKYKQSDVAKYSMSEGSLHLMPLETSANRLDLGRVHVRPLQDV